MSARVGLVRLLAFAARQLARASSLFAYGVAGSMSRAQLRRTIEAEWDGYGRTGWASHAALGEWERAFYLPHLRPGARVLLVGCGTGRDLIGLSREGFTVDGLDIASQAVAVCRERLQGLGLSARLYECAVEEARFEAVYDAAVFTWFGYGYVPESRARARTLQALHRVLAPSGRVLITYQLLGARHSRVPVAFARLLAGITGSGWRPEPGDHVEVSRGAGALPSVHFEHRFAPEEVVAEARAAGFRVLWHEQAEEGRVVLEKA